MKADLSLAEKFRVQIPGYESERGDPFGMFAMTHVITQLRIIVCEAFEDCPWDHVSVSGCCKGKSVTPTWEQMCYVKDLFFDETECVMQLHPPKSEYVNYHNHCLHLWRPMDGQIPQPPSILVGPKGDI